MVLCMIIIVFKSFGESTTDLEKVFYYIFTGLNANPIWIYLESKIDMFELKIQRIVKGSVHGQKLRTSIDVCTKGKISDWI